MADDRDSSTPFPGSDAPIEVPIGDEIDLHPFRARDVVDVARSYLEAAAERGLRNVRLIHGKGRGVQRADVQRMLASHPGVEAWSDAPPERGGWGATLVTLRRSG